MNWLRTIILLLAAFLAVFWEASFGLLRHLLGAQIDLLPPLIVYTSLRAGFETLCLLSVIGGLLFDSLSANPLGVSVLPLFLIGFALYSRRELILRDEVFAQFVLGLAASALVPLLGLILLLTWGHSPLVGWGTAWQLAVMTLGGAVVTPIFFVLFDWLERMLVQAPAHETSFRADREIRRGR